MIIRENGKLQLVVAGMDCEEVSNRIRALTNLVASADPNLVAPDSIFWAMNIINDHLPDDQILQEG